MTLDSSTGRKMKKYQKGKASTPPPMYVDSDKDPKYQAYSDSLSLSNAYDFVNEDLRSMPQSERMSAFREKQKEGQAAMEGLYDLNGTYPDYNFKKLDSDLKIGEKPEDKIISVGTMKKPEQPVYVNGTKQAEEAKYQQKRSEVQEQILARKKETERLELERLRKEEEYKKRNAPSKASPYNQLKSSSGIHRQKWIEEQKKKYKLKGNG